jgi:hypothetical protein
MEIKIKYVLNGITHIIEGRNVESDLDEELDGCQSTSFMFEISRGLRYFPKVSIPKDLETTNLNQHILWGYAHGAVALQIEQTCNWDSQPVGYYYTNLDTAKVVSRLRYINNILNNYLYYFDFEDGGATYNPADDLLTFMRDCVNAQITSAEIVY